MKEIIFIVFLTLILCIFLYLRRWKKFDPQWLLTLALEQYPQDYKLHKAIENCTRIKGNYFVSAENPNKPESEWQFGTSVTLIHPEMDEIVLDVLKDGRIGSIEYLGLLMRQ